MKLFPNLENLVRSAVLAAVPLFSCGPDECYTFNNSTITLTGQTDGVVARLSKLEAEPENVLNDETIDFLNEVHAHDISTQGIPPNTKVTSASESCFQGSAGEDFSPLFQPVHPEYTNVGGGGDVGVYMRGNQTISGAFIVNHGIGHLQPAGYLGENQNSEVIPQINANEKNLAGLAMLDPQDRTKYWLNYASRTFGLEYSLPVMMLNVNSGWISPDDAEEYFSQLINAADIFIFEGLQEYNGGFARLRQETERLAAEGLLQGAIDVKIQEFMDRYPIPEPKRYEPGRFVTISEADAITTLRMAQFRYVRETAGAQAARDYFAVTALFPSVPISEIVIQGIDNLNCATMESWNEPAREEPASCEGQKHCDRFGAQYTTPLQLRLCCFDTQGETLRKWVVEASGLDYRRFSLGRMLYQSINAYAVYDMNIDSQQQIELGEQCR